MSNCHHSILNFQNSGVSIVVYTIAIWKLEMCFSPHFCHIQAESGVSVGGCRRTQGKAPSNHISH